MPDKLIDPISSRAIQILQGSIRNSYERARSYNKNGIDYADYRLNDMESTWGDILECFARLWNTKNPDKAEDWAAYSALQAAFIEAGMPQSIFSPAWHKWLPVFMANIKELDTKTGANPGNPEWTP